MPLLTGDESTPALDDLTVGLSQVLFPIVVLLGLNGLVVGILNAHEHFTIPALAPLVWNIVIIAGLVGLTPLFEGDDQLYAYAIGVRRRHRDPAADVPAAAAPARLPAQGSRFAFRHDPRVRQVLLLMLPVSLGLGLINVSLLINSTIGFLVSEEAPTAIDAAFRIYMLPQGMFSVAVATVLFPALSRLATRRDLAGLRALIGSGMRQIALLLIPSARGVRRARDADRPARLRARRLRRRVDEPGERGAVLVLASRCRSPASRCCSRAASSASSGRGCRRGSRSARSSSTSSSPTRCTGRWGSAASCSARRSRTSCSRVLEARRLRRGARRARAGPDAPRVRGHRGRVRRCSALIAYGVWYGLDDAARPLAAGADRLGRRRARRSAALVYAAVLLRSGLPEARQIVDLFARRFAGGPVTSARARRTAS